MGLFAIAGPTLAQTDGGPRAVEARTVRIEDPTLALVPERAAQKGDRDEANAIVRRARRAYAAGRVEDAATLAAKAAALDPGHPRLAETRAWMAARAGRPAEAATGYRRLLSALLDDRRQNRTPNQAEIDRLRAALVALEGPASAALPLGPESSDRIVRRVLEAPALQACWQQAWDRGALDEVEHRVALLVSPDGRVTRASLADSAKSIEACVDDALAGLSPSPYLGAPALLRATVALRPEGFLDWLPTELPF